MNDTGTIERGTTTIWIRVLGSAILVAGYWMVQNLPEMVFDAFGGQSIGPMAIFIVPFTYVGVIPLLLGVHQLIFGKPMWKNVFSNNLSLYEVFQIGVTVLITYLFLIYIICLPGCLCLTVRLSRAPKSP